MKKLEKMNKAAKKPKTLEGKDELRTKFVQQAKKYLGIPYHPSYHTDPSSEHHEAPLYLDCCGLTRRALQDLAEDFGFLVGPGNQAYQFDTLNRPEDLIEDEKDLKVGDLVFTEGVFRKEGKKQQKYNMVHVEIYLGEGKTIGARKQAGVIEILDSYKFESKSYEITKFHFRSLDRWLDGFCQPVNDKDFWEKKFGRREKADTPEGRSVFDNCEDDDEEEEVATGESDSADVTSSKKSDAQTFYVNKSNGWQLVSDSMEKRGWTRLPFTYNFKAAYDLKWVEGRNKINFATHKTGQLCNHLPNNDVICNKIGLLSCLMEKHGANFPPKYFPNTYRLDRPADAMALLKEVDSPYASKNLWIYKPSGKNCGKGIQVVPTADLKSIVYKKQGKIFDGGEACFDGGASGEEGSGGDKSNVADGAPPKSPKAPASSPAKGGLNSPKKSEKPQEGVINSRYSTFVLQNGLVQSYITNPMLLNGKKFDVRVYALIARSAPHAIVYYHSGYSRLTLDDFTLDPAQLGNNLIHLTNAAVQKKHPDYKERKDEQIWDMDKLANYCIEKGISKAANAKEFNDDLDDKFSSVIMDVWKASSAKFQKKFGYFDLLGFDFMLTEGLEPKLLEVNTNPAMHLDCKAHEDVLPKLVDSTLNVVMAAHERSDGSTCDEVDSKTIKSAAELGAEKGVVDKDFILLVDEQSNFEYCGAGVRGGGKAVGAAIKAVKELK